MNKDSIKYIALIIGIIAVSALGIWGIYALSYGGGSTVSTKAAPRVTALAQCLADKKVTMYGAYWCEHCQKQKALFGDAFKLIPYVECTENEKLCTEKGVQGFPTWIVPGTGGEKKLEGEQSFEQLAAASGCPLQAE